MNILIIGRFYPEAFALHISETFNKMGHNPVNFEIGIKHKPQASILSKRFYQLKNIFYNNAKSIPSVQKLFFNKLSNAVTQQQLDLTLVCHDFLMPTEVIKIKKITNAPIAMWFPDHIGRFSKAMFLNSSYDALFFKDPFIVHTLKNNFDKPVYYLPECFNPYRHKINPLSENDKKYYGCDITTAGNMYSARIELFKRLKNYNIKLWGNPSPVWLQDDEIKFMYQKKYVIYEEKVKAFRAAKIVLNNLNPAEIWGINVRAFEIAGSGGFQLINWRPGLKQLFEDGKEIVSFINFESLREKLDYYLNSVKERTAISEAGYQRALKDHTYKKRLDLLINTVFNKKRGFDVPNIEYKL